MQRFKNILVGVDLSWADRYVAEELSPPNAEAVRQAISLAKLNAASIDFFYALDLSPKAEELISASAGESTILDEAETRLSELVAQARAEGIVATSHVVVGKSWLELIRQVLRQEHDLLVVGTRHLGAAQGFFLGSTGIKLLRKCPCSVWVTQPRAGKNLDSILVAHDLRPVGDTATRTGMLPGQDAACATACGACGGVPRIRCGVSREDLCGKEAGLPRRGRSPPDDALGRGGLAAPCKDSSGARSSQPCHPPLHRGTPCRSGCHGDRGSRRNRRTHHRKHGRTIIAANPLLIIGREAPRLRIPRDTLIALGEPAPLHPSAEGKDS